jgi:hypothetical protein
MSVSLPGVRELPESRYDLNTYWGRVRHAAGLTDPRLAGSERLAEGLWKADGNWELGRFSPGNRAWQMPRSSSWTTNRASFPI